MNPPGQPNSPARPRAAWEVPLFVAVLVATVWVACFAHPGVWILTGIGEPDKPFLDLRNLISAGETLQRGLDPHVTNPLDPYHRLHGYSDWWLVLGPLGITGADLPWVGALLLLLVLATAVLVCRPATAREGIDLLLVLVSPPLLMAVYRANHDLVAFILMGLALLGLRHGGPVARAWAIALLAVAAVLKYFPLAAAVLLLEARTRREFLRWIVIYGCVLLLAWPSLERSLGVAAAHTPAPAWLYAFGAPMIFRNLELDHATALGWGLVTTLLIGGAIRWWPRTKPAEPVAPAPEFFAGAIMVAGCFVHGSSYLYKLIFALWLLPWLWGRAGGPGDASDRRSVRRLLFAVLWFEGITAIVINLAATYAGLTPATGLRWLGFALVAAQLLAWALVLRLWRPLVLHGARQLQRWWTAA